MSKLMPLYRLYGSTTPSSINPYLFWLGLILALSTALSSMIGGLLNYSPIPFMDMWNGTLGFLLDSQDGSHAAWWAQHNEHRIVIARVLFWIDEYFFQGQSVFLLVCNYLFPALAAYQYKLYLQQLAPETKNHTQTQWALWFFIIALLFHWMQNQNFTWAFQSQFFLAQIMPLSALYLLAKSSTQIQDTKYFLLSLALGFVSAFIMANGILTLPIMLAFAFVLKLPRLKIVILATLALATPSLYFHQYVSPVGHGNPLDTALHHPVSLFIYTLYYLGNPFHHLGHAFIAGLFGFILLSTLLFYLYEQIKSTDSPYFIALLFYLAYITTSGLITGGGRVIFGLEQAFASRYATPSIMAWSAFILCLWFKKRMQPFSKNLPYILLAIFIGSAMFIGQFIALKKTETRLSIRQTAALALALEVKDDAYIQTLFPNSLYAMNIAARAKQKKLSIFGRSPFFKLSEEMNTPIPLAQPPSTCQGKIESLEPIEGSKYTRVQGRLEENRLIHTHSLIRFVGTNGLINGMAFPEKSLHLKKQRSRPFSGYILTSALKEKNGLYMDTLSCKLLVAREKA